ncbi:hypothetical protein [Sabulibacter ruber]|uniref:hypothetical protein n=1 Tax=Sabulibacter ruber TaxID=2811901 RepID=UPI001A97BA43|nr:hypothetical protein [Sabulibacter ruber]
MRLSGPSFLVGLLLSIMLAAPLRTQAQDFEKTVLRNNMDRIFREANKLSYNAGIGVAVMNSDYRGGVDNSLVQKVKIKGYGPTITAGLMYQFSPYVGAMTTLEYARIRGDQPATLEEDCSYCADLVSGTGSVTVHLASRPTLARLYERTFRGKILLVPYLKGGVGFLGYKVKSYNGEQEALPARKYPAVAFVIPVGGGLRARISERISLATEVTLNMPSTDYLDNRQAEGNILGANDKYVSVSLKAFYTPRR